MPKCGSSEKSAGEGARQPEGLSHFLGIARSPAFHYEPETNGCVEKFIQTLKEQILWIERFATHLADGPTDWPTVLAFYDRLVGVQDTPVVRLNRAVALAEVHGPAVALDELAGLERALDGYHLLHATRAELLRRAGDPDGARLADARALELAPSPAERSLLRRRLEPQK